VTNSIGSAIIFGFTFALGVTVDALAGAAVRGPTVFGGGGAIGGGPWGRCGFGAAMGAVGRIGASDGGGWAMPDDASKQTSVNVLSDTTGRLRTHWQRQAGKSLDS